MSQGKMFRAAYGIMLTSHEEWIDIDKVKAYAQEKLNICLEIDESDDVFEAVAAALDEHQLFGGIGYLLEHADASGQLQGAFGYGGGYYLLYFPVFPWEEKGAFQTNEQVCEQLIQTVMVFTHDSITSWEVAETIEFFNEEFS